MRHRLLVCRCLSPIKKALEGCLQQQSEYYLHPGGRGLASFISTTILGKGQEAITWWGAFRWARDRFHSHSRRWHWFGPTKLKTQGGHLGATGGHQCFVPQLGKSQVDNKVPGAKKQATRGSRNHNGAKKHTRKPANCQKEESQVHNTWARNQCWLWVLAGEDAGEGH